MILAYMSDLYVTVFSFKNSCGRISMVDARHVQTVTTYLKTPMSVKPAPATLLDATMRQSRLIMYTHRVDVNRTTLNLLRYPDTSGKTARKDCTRETIIGVIGNSDRLLLRLEWNQADTRTKALRVVQVHVLLEPGDDERTHAVLVAL